MSDFLDRIRLAIAAELERFEADERRRLAYADRSPTLERQDRQLLSDGHLGECVLTIDDGWRCAVGCRDAQLAAAERSAERQLADGTGRHSRKEIEQATGTQTIAGVQFSSVPALCAAFEQLLSASAAYLWTWRPDREHCSGPQMEAYRELRRLVAGAGKDVP